jgi:hypothetical protein
VDDVPRPWTALVLWLFLASCAACHEGPPIPLVVDKLIPGYCISVWADPDVGTGTVFVAIDPDPRAPAAPVPVVKVWIQPKSQRFAPQHFPAQRQPLRNRVQFIATPSFDQQEMFTLGVVVTPPAGSPVELIFDVEATPPGLGPWDLLVYLIPFVLFGFVWGRALLRRWR